MSVIDDPEELKKKKLADKVVEKYGRLELANTLKSYDGRAVLQSVLDECKLNEDIGSHEFQTHRELGKREIALWLRARILTIDSGYVTIMENEAKKRLEDNNL